MPRSRRCAPRAARSRRLGARGRSSLTVRTRNGHNITASVPELEPIAAALDGRSVVLDGELVARQGRPFDFYSLAPRLSAHAPASVARRRARMPVTFAAFDVLSHDGATVTGQPLPRVLADRYASLLVDEELPGGFEVSAVAGQRAARRLAETVANVSTTTSGVDRAGD